MRKTYHPIVFAVLGILATNFFWASNALLSSSVTQYIAPLHLNFWRWCFAFLCIVPFGYKVFTRLTYIRNNFWSLCLLSLLGISLYNFLLYSASLGTSATNITLINTLIPVSIVLCSALLGKQKPSRQQKLGITLGCIGALIILTRAQINNLFGIQFHLHDGFMIAAVIVWGMYSILLTNLRGNVPQIELLTLLICMGCIWLGIFECMFFGTIPIHLLYEPKNLLIFIYLGVFPSLFAYLFWNNGVQKLGPIISGLSLYTQPMYGALLGWLLFGHTLATYHVIAGICLAGALLLCVYKKS